MVACDSLPDPPPDTAIASRLKAFDPPAAAGTPAGDLDIYLDGSQSMQGFTADKDSNFCALIKEIMLNAETARFRLTSYSFSTTTRTLDHPPLAQLESAGFYTGSDTPLAKLLETIGQQPQHTAVIVSDLVQSEPGRDNQALVSALAALGGSRVMDLLAYRSSFSGSYDPENKYAAHAGLVRLNQSQKIPGQGRPFYLLILAPNAASLARVKKDLLRDEPASSPSEEFDAAQPPFRIVGVSLNHRAAASSSWQEYAPLVSEPANGFRTTFLWTGNDASPGMSALPLSIQMEAIAPVRRLESLDLEGTSGQWTAGAFSGGVATGAPALDAGGQASQGHPLNLTVNLPAKDSWRVYRIEVNPGEANLDLPPWVRNWTTDDDSTPALGNRTYQLDWLVRAMVNAVSEHRNCGDWTLEIGRGA
uniref:Uncharacterized protein n=2 Tax=Paracidobacterium acidisoli TaxID=2303751 RepID=A0A372IJJ9_9BACT